MRRWYALLLLSVPLAAAELQVFDGLDELTARIPRLASKPCEALLDADGVRQPELVIFRDAETGHEVWSLTFERCLDLANIERRPPWNADGSLISMIGNHSFRGLDGRLSTNRWSGFAYLMNADGSRPVKLFETNADGSRVDLNDKFNTFDRRRPRCLYFPALRDGARFRAQGLGGGPTDESWLVRVTLSDDLLHNRLEPLVRFPNSRRKLIQNSSDDNKLCIQDVNGRSMLDMPSFYVVDLEREPTDPRFLRSHALAYGVTDVPGHRADNEYHVHGIALSRDGRTVSWNYGPMTDVGEPIGFTVPADDLDARPTAQLPATDRWGQYLSHPDECSDGRCAYFGGPTQQTVAAGLKGGWGLWLRLPGQPPSFVGPPASGGHASWCGFDPDWVFASVSRPEPGKWETPVKGRVVAGHVGDPELRVLCNPYAQLRGGKAGYEGVVRAIQSPDATKCWFHSSMLMPSDEFTGSFLVVAKRPYAPVNLAARVVAGRLRLTWAPHAVSHELKGYHVYSRRRTETAWTEVTPGVTRATDYEAEPRGAGEHLFVVTAEEHSGLESDVTTPVVAVQVGATGLSVGPLEPPARDWRTAPPTPVAGLRVTRESAGWRLRWEPHPGRALRYYNLYCGTDSFPNAVQARRFASPPRGYREYLDWCPPPAGRVWYAIGAVDRQGQESAPTAVVAE